MRHKSPTLSTILYQLIRQQIWFERTDTISLNLLYVIECLHQIDETFTRSLAEIANIYSSQYNFLTAFNCSLLCLTHQRGNCRVS